MKSRWWLPASSGVLVGLSYFPALFLPLNLAGFLPLLAWLEGHPHATAYERLQAGLVFGTVTHLVTLHFMYSMWEHSWLAAPLYVCFAMALGVRISLSIALMGWLRRRTGLSWAWLLPICWLPFEWAQTWGDLRMTGEHLAHSVSGYPFVCQFADVVGPYGVAAFLLATNGLVFEAWRFRGRPAGRKAAFALGALLLVVLAYDVRAWLRPEEAGRSLRVALIQPDVALSTKHDAASYASQMARLRKMTLEAAKYGPELIVWPETARPFPVAHDLDRPESRRMPEVQFLARQTGSAMLVGAEYLRHRGGAERAEYNAVFGIDETGNLLDEWAAKVYLVPFAEATPFRSLLGPLVRSRRGESRWLAGGFTPGPKTVVLELADTKVGVLVCYEQLFPDLARGLRNAGAELQVVITNDAWFGRSLFQRYQADVVRLRAIESRTAFVRVANTGISGFVDSRGRYSRQTGLFHPAVEVWDVELSNRVTIYDRTGDLVAWIAIAALGVAVVLGRSPDRHGSVF